MQRARMMGGSDRYIWNGGTVIAGVLLAFLLMQKYSQITIEPYFKSLFSDVFLSGRKNWGVARAETTRLFQLCDVSNVDEWFVIFLPILTGLPFVSRWCDDLHTRQIRNMMARMGKRGYICRMFLWGNISFLLAGLLALGIYAGVVTVACDSVATLVAQQGQEAVYELLHQLLRERVDSTSLFPVYLRILKSFCQVMVGIVVSGNLVLVIGALTRNKYTSLCVPTLLFYLGCRLGKLIDQDTVAGWLNPVNWFGSLTNSGHLLLVLLTVMILCGGCFGILLNGEVNRGEF